MRPSSDQPGQVIPPSSEGQQLRSSECRRSLLPLTPLKITTATDRAQDQSPAGSRRCGAGATWTLRGCLWGPLGSDALPITLMTLAADHAAEDDCSPTACAKKENLTPPCCRRC